MGSIGYQLPGVFFIPQAVADLLKPICPISLSCFSNSISHHPTRIGIFERGVEIENINLGKNLFPEHSHTRVRFSTWCSAKACDSAVIEAMLSVC